MTFWREPELPPVQKMPRKPTRSRPRYGGRIVAGLAGVVLLAMAAIGVYRAVGDSTGASPFRALVMLLPATLLIRYALTGVIKTS